MLTPAESREALTLVTGEAVSKATSLLKTDGSFAARRALMLDGVPQIIMTYSYGSSALAADFYDDQREIAAPPKLYVAEPIILDREEKIGRAVAWATEPLLDDELDVVESRLAEVVQFETAHPYRDTITENRERDPSAVGWRRIASGGCKFCRMLADRGAVYIDSTALFAAHTNCGCTAQPVFSTDDFGEEANVMQYLASRKRRTPKQRAQLREYLNTNYSDFPG